MNIRVILYALNLLRRVDWSWIILVIIIIAFLLFSGYQRYEMMLMAILFPNEEQIGQQFSFLNPVWPIMNQYTISSPYGIRDDPISGEQDFHEGIDIAAPEWTPVFAIWDGKVITSSFDERAGGYLILEHDILDLVEINEQRDAMNMKLFTKYIHLNQAQVKAGDRVKAGEMIAFSGNTGRSTGPHLDFRILVNERGKEEYIDPEMVMLYSYQVNPIIFNVSLNLADQAADEQDEEDEPFHPEWVIIEDITFDQAESEENRKETRVKAKVKVYEVELTNEKDENREPIKNEFGIDKKEVEYGRYVSIELELRRKLKDNNGVKGFVWEVNEEETEIGNIQD